MQPSIRASARCHHLPTTRPTLRTLFLRAGSCHRADKAGNLQQPKLSAASVKGARTMNMSTNATSQSNVATAESTLAAEDLVQYVVLRRDLWTEKSWPLGSVIAQGCHASTAALWLSRESQATKAYCAPDKLDSMHKVVLEVKGEPQLQTLAKRLSDNNVEHKLWMEQPENIPTCLATAPASKSAIQQHFKKYQLCKA